MNSKQRKTLEAIWTDPASATIVFADIERLLVSLGVTVKEGKGSGVKFIGPAGEYLSFHRPHPGKEAKPYMIRGFREYLIQLGHRP
ncbi:addiction module toxin, HicA family [Novosphingobium sp. FGD1]|uniref:Addiction module toxin, HicA family n=1 Tax=Novosphingobium silvae TaxID=2692619 RepID=A0A7X4GGU7_9SPHN|nr:type II toxin-antitoxin system HicA family toxin [Novosphingobium silvae]MYL98396.1 addiction module toxin, HicA family [Novosphingobium silvae]